MAANEPDDVLARAAKELREHDEPGWSQASGAVLRAVRDATRRSTPVESTWPAGALVVPGPSGRLHVSDLVVVRLRLEGRRCVGAEVQVVARYGTDLEAAARQVRTVVVGVLDDVLGDDARRPVDMTVDDVVVHDPCP